MHVCIVTSGRPSEVAYGGETRFIISLRMWLLENGHDVTVVERRLFGSGVIGSDSPSNATEVPKRKTSSRLLQLPAIVYLFCMLLASVLLALRVVSVNKRSPISVIHAQDTGYGGLAGVIAARVLQLPVVISSHGLRYASLSKALTGVPAAILLPFEYALDVFTSRNANLIVTVSSSERIFFTNFGIKESTLRTIPVGVDSIRFAPLSAERHKTCKLGHRLTIAFIGRLAPEKNLFTLIQAFGEASAQEDKLQLVFVGSGPLETNLRDFTVQEGVGNKVAFLGVRSDIEQFIQSIDIFALPSYTEGCPISLLEAMASGKAIVASDIPSIREIVRGGEEAILVNPYDARGLRDAILRLCNDERLRSDMGRKARQRSRIYDVEAVYPDIVRAYEDIIVRELKS